jgi:predicted nucleic acid-binding protein
MARQGFDVFKPYMVGAIPAISFVTYGEALEGALQANWTEKRISDYQAHLRKYLLLPADRELAAMFARVSAECMRSGIGVNSCQNDLWIAATAMKFGIPLLSNDRLFRRIKGLTVLPPE